MNQVFKVLEEKRNGEGTIMDEIIHEVHDYTEGMRITAAGFGRKLICPEGNLLLRT